MEEHRVKFYSVTDLSIGWNLAIAEKILRQFDVQKDIAKYSINDVIELDNIGHFLDREIFLKKWTEEDIYLFCETAKKFQAIIGRFFSLISNENFIQAYLDVDQKYKEDFYQLISKYKVLERISQDTFAELLDIDGVLLYPILKCQDIVRTFGSPLKIKMLSDHSSAQLLLDKFEIQHLRPVDEIYLPSELTIEDKENIIKNYMNSENPNLGYLRLIANVQSSKDKLFLNAETLSKAKKLVKKMESFLFANNRDKGFNIQVLFSDKQPEFKIVEMKESSIIASYSSAWIYENFDYPTILNNFIYLFEYTDMNMRCNFVNQINQMGIIERELLMKSKNAYQTDVKFNIQDILSLLQIKGYCNILFGKGVRIESVIEWFFMDYLREEFGIDNYLIFMPSQHALSLEKCTCIMPAMEHVLKQFSLYSAIGIINHELLDVRSEHLLYETIPSLCPQKYVYGIIGSDYTDATFLLFSDQSGLGYYDKKQKSYTNFYDILNNESTCLDDYSDWDKPKLQWLLEHDLLSLTETNEIVIAEPLKIQILYELYYYDVVSYWKYSKQGRNIIDNLSAEGIVEFESTLLSRPESDYFNFFLNKSRFNNGLDLRNKYSHAQPYISKDSNINDRNYMIFLRLFIIIIIKINDDFCTRDRLDSLQHIQKEINNSE